MRKLINYLNLKEVGGLEMMFALTPILMGFSLGGLPLSLLMWLVLILLSIVKNETLKIANFKPLTFLVIYWTIHQLVLLFVTDVNINSIIAQLFYFASVFILYPSLNFQKLKGSLNWVAILSIIGLLFQWVDVMRGNFIHPIEIPGLDMSLSRLTTVSLRPSSFFMEPAAYVSFMVCPLTLSLMDRKYIWSIIIILSIFITTSTTGIVLSFIILSVWLYLYRAKKTSYIFIVVIGIGLTYALMNMQMFEYGLDKIENTEASTNIRLSQGPYVVSSMHSNEFIFGVPYGSAYDYCRAGRCSNVEYYGETVYMSTFWDMILLYGFVGLFLYLFIYYRLFKLSKMIWPLLACLFATMFSDPDGIKGDFVYKLIFMLAIVMYEKKLLIGKQKSIHQS